MCKVFNSKKLEFVIFAVIIFLISIGSVAAGATKDFLVTSGSDASDGSAEAFTQQNLAALNVSDALRIQSDGNWTTGGEFDELQFIEFVFSPDVPSNAVISNVNITHEFRRSGVLNGAKLEIFNGSIFVNQTLTIPPSNNADFNESIDITSIINTADKVNGLIVRFLAFRNTAAAQTRTSHDFINISVIYNTPPSANAGTDQSVSEGDAVNLDGSASSDPDGDGITFSWTQTAGTAVTLSDATASQPTFTAPDVTPSGETLTFQLEVSDGSLSSTDTVDILVNNINQAPVCNNVNIFTNEDTQGSTETNCTDADGDGLTFAIVDQASNGTASVGSLLYDPNADFNGVDSFTYKANDGQADSNTATVDVNVHAINDLPTVDVDVTPDTAFTDDTLTCDFVTDDIEGDTVTTAIRWLEDGVEIVDETSSTLDSSLTTKDLEYTCEVTPNNGTDDGVADLDSVVISNSPPVANDDAYSTDEDITLNVAAPGVLDNDVDDDGDSLTAFGLIDDVDFGNLSLNLDGSFEYVPDENFNGEDSFTYVAHDETDLSNNAVVTITVNAINDAPVADAQSVETDEDTAVIITLTGSDIEGDVLTFSIVDVPLNGVLSEVTGDQVTYTPNLDFSGADSFTFIANDGTDDSNVATVDITVIDTTAPTISSENVLVDLDVDFNENVIANPGDILKVTWDNSETGDNNEDVDSVTVDFSAVGVVEEDNSAIPALDDGELQIEDTCGDEVADDGIWTACYDVDPASEDNFVDGEDVSFTITATDLTGNSAQGTTSNTVFVDNKVPEVISVEATSPTTIVITFSEDLDDAQLATTDFAVFRTFDGVTLSDPLDISSISEVDGVVTLTLASPLQEGDNPQVVVNPEEGGSIVDLAGNELTETDTVVDVVDEIDPVVAIDQTDLIVNVGQEINFTGSASDVFSGVDSDISWDFGDGGSSTGSPVSNTYLEEGVFTVTATATDNEGNEGADEINVIVGTANFTDEDAEDVVLAFEDLPEDGVFTLEIEQTNETNVSTSGFLVAGQFFEIESDLEDGTFNVTLTFTYDDADNDGIVDGTTISETSLDVYFFNGATWTLVPAASRDTDANTITVIVDHFTTFALLAAQPSAPSTSDGGTTLGAASPGGGGGVAYGWECTAWSACSADGEQTRSCSLVPGSGPITKPEETQTCTYAAPEEVVEEESVEEETSPQITTAPVVAPAAPTAPAPTGLAALTANAISAITTPGGAIATIVVLALIGSALYAGYYYLYKKR